jgi:hypothetical protein
VLGRRRALYGHNASVPVAAELASRGANATGSEPHVRHDLLSLEDGARGVVVLRIFVPFLVADGPEQHVARSQVEGAVSERRRATGRRRHEQEQRRPLPRRRVVVYQNACAGATRVS